MSKQIHEYAFDATLFATVRVTCESEDDARKAAEAVLDAAELNWSQDDISVWGQYSAKVTDVSVGRDDSELVLLEVDGEETS